MLQLTNGSSGKNSWDQMPCLYSAMCISAWLTRLLLSSSPGLPLHRRSTFCSCFSLKRTSLRRQFYIALDLLSFCNFLITVEHRFFDHPVKDHLISCRFKSACLRIHNYWDFPGGLLVKTSLSNAGDVGLISGWGAKIPQCLTAKKTKHKTEAI